MRISNLRRVTQEPDSRISGRLLWISRNYQVMIALARLDIPGLSIGFDFSYHQNSTSCNLLLLVLPLALTLHFLVQLHLRISFQTLTVDSQYSFSLQGWSSYLSHSSTSISSSSSSSTPSFFAPNPLAFLFFSTFSFCTFFLASFSCLLFSHT
jgi:hypothetical protein